MLPRGLSYSVAVLALTLGIAACGSNQGAHNKSAGGQAAGISNADANNDGAYVHAGGITYQLQISRELNQYSTEDSQYVRGLPAGTTSLTPSQIWYGVFLWAKNQTGQPHMTTGNFMVTDTEGTRYYPLKLNPELNPYAWTARKLYAGQQEPLPETTAYFGPTQGGLLLFKIGVSAYDNRPLTLHIMNSAGQTQATISLDL